MTEASGHIVDLRGRLRELQTSLAESHSRENKLLKDLEESKRRYKEAKHGCSQLKGMWVKVGTGSSVLCLSSAELGHRLILLIFISTVFAAATNSYFHEGFVCWFLSWLFCVMMRIFQTVFFSLLTNSLSDFSFYLSCWMCLQRRCSSSSHRAALRGRRSSVSNRSSSCFIEIWLYRVH